MIVATQANAAAVFTGLSGLGAWKAINRNLDERLARFAKEPVIAREIANFKSKVGSVTTADALVKDQRLYEFALTAYELEGQENSQGLMRRVLSEDLSLSTSAANRMSDQRFKLMAQDLGFAGGGSSTRIIDKMAEAYVRGIYEIETGTELNDITTGTQDVALADIADRPEVVSEIAFFKSAIGDVKTGQDLVDEPRLTRFLLRAAGFVRTATVNVDDIKAAVDSSSARTRLDDNRWQALTGYLADLEGGTASDAESLAAQTDVVVDRWLKASFAEETGVKVTDSSTAFTKVRFETFSQRADIQAQVDAFREKIEGMGDADELIDDEASRGFLLRAFGVESMTRIATSVSLGDEGLKSLVEDADAAANYGDERWATFSDFFAPVRAGTGYGSGGVTKQVDAVVDRWLKASFALETGREINDGSSEALLAKFEDYKERTDIAAKVLDFRTRVVEMSGPTDLAADPTASAFVLRAFGAESLNRNLDLVVRAMQSPVTSRTSPAFYDSRLKELAEGMAFLGKTSLPATTDSEFVDKVVEKYVRVQFEKALGASDTNMRYALYAQRTLPKVTSPFTIMGDLPLRQFVFSAVGIPVNSQQDVDQLATAVKAKVEMDQLKDATYLEKLTQRFFARSATTATTQTSSPLLTLLGGNSGTTSSIGIDMLLQMQARR